MPQTADIADADFASNASVVDNSDAGYEQGNHPISSTVELGRRPAFTRTDSEETSPPIPSLIEPGLSEEPSLYATTLLDAESSIMPAITLYPPPSLTSVQWTPLPITLQNCILSPWQAKHPNSSPITLRYLSSYIPSLSLPSGASGMQE